MTKFVPAHSFGVFVSALPSFWLDEITRKLVECFKEYKKDFSNQNLFPRLNDVSIVNDLRLGLKARTLWGQNELMTTAQGGIWVLIYVRGDVKLNVVKVKHMRTIKYLSTHSDKLASLWVKFFTIAHLQKEWKTGERVGAHSVVGSFCEHEVEYKPKSTPKRSHNWTRAHPRPRFPLFLKVGRY